MAGQGVCRNCNGRAREADRPFDLAAAVLAAVRLATAWDGEAASLR